MNDRKLTKFKKWESCAATLYFILYIVIALSLLCRQPFGDPPDEHNRYLIPQYIAEHGTLPNGFDESIRIPGYGFSYAFQPILPYMLQGYVMRFAGLFTANGDVLILSARLVDFTFGLIFAVFVLLLGRKWFADKRLQYVFSYLVVFLPQSIFVHTYINTDSCCMMSIAVMLYGLTCCLQNGFRYPSCAALSAGIIFCALSYYNAYGFILSCILLFAANYLSPQNGKLHLDFGPFLRKGLFISALVLLGIGWWFVRSYILYDGDFLGLRTRDLCAELYAPANMKPGFRITYESLGFTLPKMLLKSDFFVLTINSFIAMYGPMIVYTALWIYRAYKLLFLVSILSCLVPRSLRGRNLLPRGNSSVFLEERPALRFFFHLNLLFCIAVPFILSIIYSYRIDYQPQGRYIMPILIPFAYFCTCGLGKLPLILSMVLRGLSRKKPAGGTVPDNSLTGLCLCVMLFIVAALIVTVYGYAFPYYAKL